MNRFLSPRIMEYGKMPRELFVQPTCSYNGKRWKKFQHSSPLIQRCCCQHITRCNDTSSAANMLTDNYWKVHPNNRANSVCLPTYYSVNTSNGFLMRILPNIMHLKKHYRLSTMDSHEKVCLGPASSPHDYRQFHEVNKVLSYRISRINETFITDGSSSFVCLP